MNIRPPKDNDTKDIVPVETPELPAVKKPPNAFRLHRILIGHADALLDRSEALDELERKLMKPGQPLPDADEVQLTSYELDSLKRARDLVKKLDPADAYEDEVDEDVDADLDCEDEPRLKRKHIAKRLALMIAAIPTGKAGTPDGFVKMLLEHVADADVCALSLEGACRELEETQKFLPTISEVLSAIRVHREQWGKRRSALRGVERTSERLQARIEQLRPKAELEAARRIRAETGQTLRERMASLVAHKKHSWSGKKKRAKHTN